VCPLSVPGGGTAYLRCLEELSSIECINDDEKVGVDMLRKALEEPLKRILINAGLEPSEILQKVKSGQNDFGFNAKIEKFENLLESGIIDPVKVTRLALEYAASVAGMFISTECVIAKKPEKKENSILSPSSKFA
jgi:chaperonin GroEL